MTRLRLRGHGSRLWGRDLSSGAGADAHSHDDGWTSRIQPKVELRSWRWGRW